MSIFDFAVQTQDGNAVSLSEYKGKVLLIVNTAFAGFGMNPMALALKGVVKKMDKDYKNNGKIKWNFTKSLIDREGNIAARFEPTEAMDHVKAKVEESEEKLTGVLCGRRTTSCADQLAKAVRAAYGVEKTA